MFGHTFELLIVLLLGLLIFGPKRIIEMGAAAGKMLRELREAMKDMNWNSLSGDEHNPNPLAELRDLPRNLASTILNPPPTPAAPTTPPAAAPQAPAAAETPQASAPEPVVVESEPLREESGE
jgi:TatA/E family protein of Tat protein translocase